MTRRLVTFALVLGLTLTLLPVVAAPAHAKSPARCGPGDRTEQALQGQVPRSLQLEGFKGYRCGMRLVGQNTVNNRGGNHQLATLGTCAYYATTALAGSNPAYPDNGVAVIDAKRPSNPRLVTVLRTPGALEALEALHAYNGIIAMASGNILDVYDARSDCRKPVHKATFTLPIWTHGFRLSDDGKTVYALGHGAGSTGTRGGRYLVAVDISKPATPRLLLEYPEHGGHDMDLNPAGTRAYIAGEGGLITLDTSQIQRRRANPKIRMISKLTWPAGLSLTSHTAKWVRQGGRRYIIASNEAFKTTCDGRPQARHIDITNERKPKVIVEYGLEVNDADLCNEHRLEQDGLSYNVHYVGVDNKRNARLVFWNWFASGLRVFDIRNPRKPREIAYYNPPVKTDAVQKGGLFAEELQWVDLTTPYMWFKPKTGHVWIGSANNGFQILRFTGHARRVNKLRSFVRSGMTATASRTLPNPLTPPSYEPEVIEEPPPPAPFGSLRSLIAAQSQATQATPTTALTRGAVPGWCTLSYDTALPLGTGANTPR